MTSGRKEAAELGQWIAAERAKRLYRGKPVSTTVLAKLFNTYVKSENIPVKAIAQQEISALENATIDRGPKRFQPWFLVLREFIEKGSLDELLAAIDSPAKSKDESVVVDFWLATASQETLVRTPDGKVAGTIVWHPKDRN